MRGYSSIELEQVQELLKLREKLDIVYRATRRFDSTPAGNSWFDTRKIFEVYNTLQLKPGYSLRLLTSDRVRYAGPYMFAVPDHLLEAPIPERTEGTHDVPGALSNFMEAVEGDDTLWSYLCASLIRRDADELGAYHTGVRFGDQQLIFECPRVGGNKPVARPAWGTINWLPVWMRALRGYPSVRQMDNRGTATTNAESSWKWVQATPTDWRPQVQMTDEQVVVSFYTYRYYYGESILHYFDTYQRENYYAQTELYEVARGPSMVVC